MASAGSGRQRRTEDEQAMVELGEKHAAHRLLEAARRSGDLSEREYLRRRNRVYHAVTPRDLWKASGGRAGAKGRSDWKAIRKSVVLQVAIVVFAALAMLLIWWGIVVYTHPSAA